MWLAKLKRSRLDKHRWGTPTAGNPSGWWHSQSVSGWVIRWDITLLNEFSSAGCAGFCNEPGLCNEPQHPLLNNTSRKESFHTLIEKVQNEKKQRDLLGPVLMTKLRIESGVHQWLTAHELCHCRCYFPSSFVMIQAQFLPFFCVFSSSFSTGAAVTWARSQPARVVCPALKAMSVITASHLAPERCKLPFLFYYFLPFIDDQAWRIFFF